MSRSRKFCANKFVISPSSRVLACNQDAAVGQSIDRYREQFFQRVLHGKPSVSQPFRSPLLLADEQGELKVGLPTMFVAAPIVDEAGKPLAVRGA